MKIINKKNFKIAITILISAFLAFSCSKKENKNTDELALEQVEEEKPRRPQWQNTAEKICIVFGYGYNSKEFVENEVEHLNDFFGLSDGTENSGLIIPYVYPDDFLVGNTGRISKLTKLLEDVKIAGVITLGAPEYTSNTLSLLRDKMNTEDSAINSNENSLNENSEKVKPYPIYTFFPQDDILAIEATSDFVLDKAVEQTDKIEELHEEVEQVHVSGIEDIIDNAIDYMLLTKSPLKSDSTLYGHVNSIIGDSNKIKRYIDPETGLSSINHFILEDSK